MAHKIRRNRKVKAKRRIRTAVGLSSGGGFKLAVHLTAVAALSLFLILCHDLITQCAVFEARTIRVDGSQRLARADILAQARIQPGMNILGLNLSLARKRLLAHPWIAEAEIRREIPSGLVIRITEHRPLAVLDLGRKFLIDASGVIFKEMDAQDPPGLPWVHGLRFSDLHPTSARSRMSLPNRRAAADETPGRSSVYDAVIRVLCLDLRENDLVSERAIKKILVDRELGLTLMTAHRRTAIKLGFDEFPVKYQMLQKIFEFLDQGRLLNWREAATIDLKNLNRVVLNPIVEEFKTDG
jgi:cell division protein FtsQ